MEKYIFTSENAKSCAIKKWPGCEEIETIIDGVAFGRNRDATNREIKLLQSTDTNVDERHWHEYQRLQWEFGTASRKGEHISIRQRTILIARKEGKLGILYSSINNIIWEDDFWGDENPFIFDSIRVYQQNDNYCVIANIRSDYQLIDIKPALDGNGIGVYMPIATRHFSNLDECKQNIPAGYHQRSLGISPELITSLNANQVFVFGSNELGKHVDGASKIAKQCFGAEEGVGEGPTGQCYAITTTTGGLLDIYHRAQQFIQYAREHPEKEFLLTRIGCGAAMWLDEDISILFYNATKLGNVLFPMEWIHLIFSQDYHNRTHEIPLWDANSCGRGSIGEYLEYILVLNAVKKGARLEFEHGMITSDSNDDLVLTLCSTVSAHNLSEARLIRLKNLYQDLNSLDRQEFLVHYEKYLSRFIYSCEELPEGTTLNPGPIYELLIQGILTRRNCKKIYNPYSGCGSFANDSTKKAGMTFTYQEPSHKYFLISEVIHEDDPSCKTLYGDIDTDWIYEGHDGLVCIPPLNFIGGRSGQGEKKKYRILSRLFQNILNTNGLKVAIVAVNESFLSGLEEELVRIRRHIYPFISEIAPFPENNFKDYPDRGAILVLDFGRNEIDSTDIVIREFTNVFFKTPRPLITTISKSKIIENNYCLDYHIYNKGSVDSIFEGKSISHVRLNELISATTPDNLSSTSRGISISVKPFEVLPFEDGNIVNPKISPLIFSINDSKIDRDYLLLVLRICPQFEDLCKFVAEHGKSYFPYITAWEAPIIEGGLTSQRQFVDEYNAEHDMVHKSEYTYNVVTIGDVETNLFKRWKLDCLKEIKTTEGTELESELCDNNKWRIDAVIVNSACEKTGSGRYKGLRKVLKKHDSFPVFVIHDDEIAGLREDLDDNDINYCHGRVFPTEKMPELIRALRAELSRRDSPETKIRNQYKDVFDAADAIDRKYELGISKAISTFILKGCRIEEDPTAGVCGSFRNAGHSLIGILQKNNLVPPALDPGAIPPFLRDRTYKNKNDNTRYYQYQNLMDESLAEAMCYFCTITNSGVHGSQDSSRLGQAALHILMEFILWFNKEMVEGTTLNIENVPSNYFWGTKDDAEPFDSTRNYTVQRIAVQKRGKDTEYFFAGNVHIPNKPGLKEGDVVRISKVQDESNPIFNDELRIIFFAKEFEQVKQ